MFYNTGIGTFIWVLSNKKEDRRKGKIQLIDATSMKSPLRKNMGNKNCEFTPEIRNEIVRIFTKMEESEVSMVLNNDEFAYWTITVERPLRLRVYPNREIPSGTFKKAEELETVKKSLASVPPEIRFHTPPERSGIRFFSHHSPDMHPCSGLSPPSGSVRRLFAAVSAHRL